MNVITKSGGNEFHGDVFGYYDDDSLQADNKNVGETLQGSALGNTKEDYGADLGGFILRDRLWFFLAYDRVTNTVQNELTSGPFEGQVVESESRRNLGAGKITWGFLPGHSLVASLIQDPRTDSGAINDANHTLNGERETFEGRQDYGGRNYSLRYDGLLGSAVALPAGIPPRAQLDRTRDHAGTSCSSSTRARDFITGASAYPAETSRRTTMALGRLPAHHEVKSVPVREGDAEA